MRKIELRKLKRKTSVSPEFDNVGEVKENVSLPTYNILKLKKLI